MDEKEVLIKMILQKLIRGSVWGGKHTPLDFVRKGVPDHYKNTHKGERVLDDALKQVVNNGWAILILKRTGKGSDEHISLNPRKISEINQFLERVK
ncbi:hypothetical protein J4457_04350 [Candidatus Woesearchaeota archaeon]|nr:hypothetical protein [Candidatus Woesearchaeota archaeon]